MHNIKNVIFDLGGVLLNIDYNKTISAFENLGIPNFKNNYSPLKMSSLFQDIETGKITEEDFYNGIKNITQIALTNEEIKIAWNAMLLNFRPASLPFLEKLSQQYQLYLLSNTNSIHLTAFNKIFVRDTGKPSLDAYFSKAYYSHLIGFRKPNSSIYDFVLNDASIKCSETIFIDDLKINTDGAAALGINTHLLLPEESIETLPFFQ